MPDAASSVGWAKARSAVPTLCVIDLPYRVGFAALSPPYKLQITSASPP